MRKTIEDVTREDLIRLVESTIELLSCARLMFWLSGGDADKDDKSLRATLDESASALEQIGLSQGTIEEFEGNIEAILIKSGKWPEEWRRLNVS